MAQKLKVKHQFEGAEETRNCPGDATVQYLLDFLRNPSKLCDSVLISDTFCEPTDLLRDITDPDTVFILAQPHATFGVLPPSAPGPLPDSLNRPSGQPNLEESSAKIESVFASSSVPKPL
jgi:hypothetical protein